MKDSITRAGAGAGKTTGLVKRVVEVFRTFRARGETPRIVLTTFTRKATQELKERLIEFACEARDPDLLQFASDPARLQIATIHGLLNTFLRQVGHLAGMDSGFQIVGEAEAYHLARLALRETIVASGEGLEWLETYGFARVLLMCRLYDRHLHEKGELGPATFEDLEAAATRRIDTWKTRLSDLATEIEASVGDAKLVAYARNLSEFADQWDGHPETIAVPRKPNASAKQPELADWHERIKAEIAEFKDEMKASCWRREKWPETAAAWAAFDRLARAFEARLRQLKESQARYEMNDLELKSIEILRLKPFLGTLFADNWDYWMIDEYQDTSPLQVECLHALIGNRPKYFVGDPQQSIYLFRGAEVRVFDQAEEAVRARGGNAHALLRNWRSRPDLLLFMNDFMRDIGGDAFLAMDPREAPTPFVRPAARLIETDDRAREFEAVVSRIGELVEGGARLEQICVLGRTHGILMDVSRALKAYDYPTHVHSSRGFDTRREVIDAQALWKFLVNPHDNANLMILLRSPWFYTPDAVLVAWMEARPKSLWIKLGGEDAPEPVLRLRALRERLEREGLTRTFEAGLLEAGYLDLSLANDPAGRKESNLWKLVSKARALEKEGGSSALDFLVRDSGDNALEAAEGDAASAQEPNCINLMTIHGAKGLQFDHVIVPGLGDQPRKSNVPELATTARSFHFPVWSDDENKALPTVLDDVANEEMRRREVEEFDRWLYVAITRAKESLTLVWSDKKRGSWSARSHYCALEPGLHRHEHYVFERTNDFRPPERYQARSEFSVEIRRPWGRITPLGEERLSVTEIIAPPAERGAWREPKPPANPLGRWRAQTVGTRIHRALEALKYGRSAEAPDFAEGLDYVMNLTEPPMQELIAKGSTEWGFQIRTSPKTIVEGQIDLWAKHDGTLWVVDYKSGSPEFSETAFDQLQIYAWALRRFGHTEPAKLVVIYPLEGKVKTRDFAPELLSRWESKLGRA